MLEPYAGKLARPVLRGPGRSQDLASYPTLETNILLVSPRKCAHCCQALGGSAAQTLKTLGHQSRCAAGSPGILLSIEAKVACSVATTCAPSPTAAATRLTEPERTSPIAKTPGRLVSSRLWMLPPVRIKPLSSI